MPRRLWNRIQRRLLLTCLRYLMLGPRCSSSPSNSAVQALMGEERSPSRRSGAISGPFSAVTIPFLPPQPEAMRVCVVRYGAWSLISPKGPGLRRFGPVEPPRAVILTPQSFTLSRRAVRMVPAPSPAGLRSFPLTIALACWNASWQARSPTELGRSLFLSASDLPMPLAGLGWLGWTLRGWC